MNDDKIESIAREILTEFRRYRRGRWWARAFWAILILALIFFPMVKDLHTDVGRHSALIDLSGVIGIGEDASSDRINEGLRAAFESSSVKGVILRVNSPGGSPVQSRQINQEIARLRSLHPDIPVYTVVEEICASGAYYVAVASDRIFVDPASLVGSIGVRLDSFGLVEALEKLGIERRLFTAGSRKGALDPFLPLQKDDVEFVESLIEPVHRQFIEAVEKGRGERLNPGDTNLFSGMIWGGEEALQLGLADDYGTVDSVARDIIGEEQIVDYTPGYDLFEEISRELSMQFSLVLTRIIEKTGWRLQ
ncbi:MAG: peptidase [marine bacterium B5-7]|nr:MAG: peptidase [marine bacterium B5-7]